MQDNKIITLAELKKKAQEQWQIFNDMIEYKRELLDAGKTNEAERVQDTIDYVNAKWAMLDDLVEELENKQ